MLLAQLPAGVTVSVAGAPYGSITATNCTISSGNSSCNTTLNWGTTNPVNTSAVTTPMNITVATGNSGPTTYPVTGGSPNGSRTFYLYNNGSILDNKLPPPAVPKELFGIPVLANVKLL